MTDEESAAVYERYAVPGPGRAAFQGAPANFNPHAATKIDFDNNDRAPVLLIAGEVDHTAPVSLTRREYKLESKSKAITAFKEFGGPPTRSDNPAGKQSQISHSTGPSIPNRSTIPSKPQHPTPARATRSSHAQAGVVPCVTELPIRARATATRRQNA